MTRNLIGTVHGLATIQEYKQIKYNSKCSDRATDLELNSANRKTGTKRQDSENDLLPSNWTYIKALKPWEHAQVDSCK